MREHVSRQARQPVVRILRMAPASALVAPDPLGGDGEGRDPRGPHPAGQRVAALAGQLAVGKRLGARVGERDERKPAEAQFTPPAANDEPLDPAPRAAGLYLQVQAVAITATDIMSPLVSIAVH